MGLFFIPKALISKAYAQIKILLKYAQTAYYTDPRNFKFAPETACMSHEFYVEILHN
jgi:hypothetical protein